MRYWTAEMERADALLFGRVTYEMMESAWRKPATDTWPDWMDEWQIPFAEAIDRAKKYVVSSTLSGVDWNAELVRPVSPAPHPDMSLARGCAACHEWGTVVTPEGRHELCPTCQYPSLPPSSVMAFQQS